ncbi:hypothetical protein PG985_011120 [Apiospora marii]|uniref:uncharacterized protein n=1 Tax=Apiospora marii TaxID=335849 RepID=UPI003131D267
MFSTLAILALGISLGNAIALPSEDGSLILRARDDDGPLPWELEGVEDWTEEGDADAPFEGRAVRHKYHFQNFPRKSGKCATHSYSGANVKDAGVDAGKLADRGKTLGTGKYPHVYNNREKVKFSAKCKGKTLDEFPILADHKLFTGRENNPAVAPGPDRVVVAVSKPDKKGSVNVVYCGLMTHTGAPVRNGFVACS